MNLNSNNCESRIIVQDKNITDVLELCAELKSELLDFGLSPRFDRERRKVLTEYLSDDIFCDKAVQVSGLDYFLLEHKVRGGKTVLERFVESRKGLSTWERDLLLRWNDVVEGVFEIHGRDGDALIVENLIDELTYRVYSNMGPGVFSEFDPDGFISMRIVPLYSAWMVSGDMLGHDGSERTFIYRLACAFAMQFPRKAFRNPDKLAQAREVAKREHERFVKFFGSDFVVFPGSQLTDQMRSFYDFCCTEIASEVEESGEQPTSTPANICIPPAGFPQNIVDSDAVAVMHSESEGSALYSGFDLIEKVFTDPRLMKNRDYRRRITDYLNDDTVHPPLFDQLARIYPDTIDEVFRSVLGRNDFEWHKDGEKLMRKRKANYYQKPRMPQMVPISLKLQYYLTEE